MNKSDVEALIAIAVAAVEQRHEAQLATLKRANERARELLKSIADNPPGNWWYGKRLQERIDAFLTEHPPAAKER